MHFDDVGPLWDRFDDPVDPDDLALLDEEDLEEDLDVDDLEEELEDTPEVIVLPWTRTGIHIKKDDEDTIAQRDERIQQYDGDAGHAEIREYLRKTGIAEDVQEALEGLSSEEYETTSEEGEVLDMRNVVRLLAGDTTVEDYYRAWTERPGDDIAVGVSLDMSGSMQPDELEAKAAVGAFLFGVQNLGGPVVANGWYSHRGVQCEFITTSGEPFRWSHLDAVSPGGGTPTARGVLECGMMLRKVQASERLLVVITDGRPTGRSLEGDPHPGPFEEVQHVVDELRALGITVFFFGFGRVLPENLEEMAGDVDGEPQYRHVDLEDLPGELVDLYAEHRESQLLLTV